MHHVRGRAEPQGCFHSSNTWPPSHMAATLPVILKLRSWITNIWTKRITIKWIFDCLMSLLQETFIGKKICLVTTLKCTLSEAKRSTCFEPHFRVKVPLNAALTTMAQRSQDPCKDTRKRLWTILNRDGVTPGISS